MKGLAKRCLPNLEEASLECLADGKLLPGACEAILRWEEQILEMLRTHFRVASCDESVYTGGPGVAYALLRARKAGHDVEAKDYLEPWRGRVAQQAAKYPDLACSLLCGRAGFLLVEGLLQTPQQVVREYLALAPMAANPQVLQADEWLYGRAGYLHGLLALQALGAESPELSGCISRVARVMLVRGEAHARQLQADVPLMWQWYGDRYMGAAHGVMGIVFMLLHVPEMREGRSLELLRQSLEWLAGMRQPSGNWPIVFGEAQADCVHFCHGAPGAILLFCKAWEVLQEERWLQLAEEAGEVVWKYGVLKKGPGICHGIAGNGYGFLSLHRCTQHPRWLARAWRFAERIFDAELQRQQRRPDHPLSLFEGWAGTLCFLLDLRLRPQAATFPLFELDAPSRKRAAPA